MNNGSDTKNLNEENNVLTQQEYVKGCIDGVYCKEDAYRTLDRINFWLNSFDTKAYYLLVIFGVVGTIIFTNNFLDNVNLCNWSSRNNFVNIIYLLLYIMIILSFITSLYYLVRCIRPRSESPIKKDNITIFHYRYIAENMDHDKILNIEKLTDKEIVKTINNQIYVCSIICVKKESNLKHAINFMVCFTVSFLLFEVIKHFL